MGDTLPFTVEDDRGSSSLLMSCSDTRIDAHAVIEIHKLTYMGVLPFEYRAYDDPPCIIWDTTELISLAELLVNHEVGSLATLITASLYCLCQLIRKLPELPILEQQIAWSPQYIFVPHIGIQSLERLAARCLRGEITYGELLRFLCVPWIPFSGLGEDTEADTLEWYVGFFQQCVSGWPEDLQLELTTLHPPYNAQELHELLTLKKARILQHLNKETKHLGFAVSKQKKTRQPDSHPLNTLTTASRLIGEFLRRQKRGIAIVLGASHLLLIVLLMLLFRQMAASSGADSLGELIALFPGSLTERTRQTLQSLFAVLLVMDLIVLAARWSEKKIQLTDEEKRNSASMKESESIASSLVEKEAILDGISLLPEDPILYATLTTTEAQRRMWRNTQCAGINTKGQAFIALRDYYIGSDIERADLVIEHPGISPLHARIFQRQGMFYITDLATGSCTKLEGRTLVRFDDYLLPPDCTLTFGKLDLIFQSSANRQTPSSAITEEGAI